MGLSPHGHHQARAMADYLRSHRFDALYASPMKRVQETVHPLGEHHELHPTLMPELQEVDFGKWTGLSWDEVWQQYQMSAYAWLDLLEADRIPEAEPADQFRERVSSGLRAILKANDGCKVGIVCHGGVIRMALSILLNMPLAKMKAFDIEYASLSRLHHHPERTEIQLLNFAPWRDL